MIECDLQGICVILLVQPLRKGGKELGDWASSLEVTRLDDFLRRSDGIGSRSDRDVALSSKMSNGGGQ